MRWRPRRRTPAAADAAVLFPDVELEVGDPDGGGSVALSVREFRLLDGLHAQAEAKELILSLAAAAVVDEAVPAKIEYDAVIGAHAEDWIGLLARATGRDPEWLGRLADEDAFRLNDAMWEANGPFFVRRIAAALTAARENPSPSPGSSPTSSPPATDATSGRSPDASPAARPSSPGGTPTTGEGTSPEASR